MRDVAFAQLRRRVGRLVLEMHQRHATAILIDRFDRLRAGNRHPEHVEFELDQRRMRRAHQDVEPASPVGVASELEGVIVIAQLQARPGRLIAHPVQSVGKTFESRAVGGTFGRRHPRHDDIADP